MTTINQKNDDKVINIQSSNSFQRNVFIFLEFLILY